jgi:hypothetical protein
MSLTKMNVKHHGEGKIKIYEKRLDRDPRADEFKRKLAIGGEQRPLKLQAGWLAQGGTPGLFVARKLCF